MVFSNGEDCREGLVGVAPEGLSCYASGLRHDIQKSVAVIAGDMWTLISSSITR